MTEQTVLANIVYWDAAHSWSYNGSTTPQPVSLADQRLINQWISFLYEHSPVEAAGMLDRGASYGGKIYIGETSGLPETVINNPAVGVSYTLVNLDYFNNLKMIDQFGNFIPDDPKLALAHELEHQVDHTLDPVGYNTDSVPTEAEKNSSDYDFDGPTVHFEKEVAVD